MDQNTNCNCQMCQKWGWCPAGKWCKIIGIVVLLLVLIFIGKTLFCYGGRGLGQNYLPKDMITVTGKGEIMVKPDIATVSFGVTAESLDVSKAQTESATKINNIMSFLKTKGVEEKDIKTTNYNIYPRYDYQRVSALYPYDGKQVLSAYVVSQTVEIKIRKTEEAGEILAGIGKLGVTDISGLSFVVDNQDEIKDQARALAITDAKEQAKILSKALGVRLVKITSFSENGNYPMYYAMEKSAVMGMGGADAVAPQMSTGESKITSNVSITYEIK